MSCLKKHAVRAFSDRRSKHHDPAHVAAFVIDPTNFPSLRRVNELLAEVPFTLSNKL